MYWGLCPQARTDAGWREQGEDRSLSLTCLTYILLLLSRKQERIIGQSHGSFRCLLFLDGFHHNGNLPDAHDRKLLYCKDGGHFDGGVNILFYLFLGYSIMLEPRVLAKSK